MTRSQFIKRFNALKKEISKNRDALRDLISEANDILDTNNAAADAMEDAADRLSELL